MLGLAVGQLLIGPFTDKYGRKRPLLWCMLLFVLSTIGCMLSTGFVPFVAFRLMQGLTGASGLVISKVIIADSFSPADLSKYFAFLAAVQGAAPIVAPVVGGVAFSLSSWQGAFAVLALWGLLLLLAWPFALFEVFLFLMLFCVGMVTPAAITLALRSVKENRGMAAALLGAVPFLLGGIVAPLTGIGQMLFSTTLVIMVCSAICVCLWILAHKPGYEKE